MAITIPVGNPDLGARATAGLLARFVLVLPRWRLDQGAARTELRFLSRANVGIPCDAPVAIAQYDPWLAGTVPVSHYRVRVALRGHDLLAVGLELLPLAIGRLLARPLVGDQPDVPLDAADQQVEFSGAAPVTGKHGRSSAKLDRLSVLVLEHLPCSVLALALAAEEIELARPAAGQDIGSAIAVEVHELWSEADASARRDLGLRATSLEPLKLLEAEVALLARSGINAEFAFSEL